MNKQELIEKLKEKKLRITPQRIAIFEAISILKNHPTADEILTYIQKKHSNISVGTVYKVLESLVTNNLIEKVKTDNDVMRYDSILSKHHHLYCSATEKIEDYENVELDEILKNYFKKKKIKNFNIKDIKLQLTGTFKN
jgi:Fur family peroxide stress response transcriptional regulator